MTIRSLLGALTLAGATSLAFSDVGDTFEIDPQHSLVNFTIKHGIYAIAHGSFDAVSGEIVLDKADPSKSSVKAAIDIGSIHTAYKQRDSDPQGSRLL